MINGGGLMKELTLKQFIESKSFNEHEENIRKLIKEILILLREENLDFLVKVRKDNSIVLVPKKNIQKNICTLMIYKKHIRIIILNEFDENIEEIKDIDSMVIEAFKNKYSRLIVDKVQMSVYLDSSMVEELDKESQKSGQKVHDIIIEALTEKIKEKSYFIDNKHKQEFSILIQNSGLDDEVKYIYRLEEKLRKRITLFYVIAAYQDDYLKLHDVKFTVDTESKVISGPTYVINNWRDELYSSCYNMYGLITSIIDKEKINILEYFEQDFGDEMIFIFNIAMKILKGSLTIKGAEIVKAKTEILTGPLLEY